MTIERAKLKRNTHPVAQARIRWSEIEGWARYLRPLAKLDEVLPDMLPTAQAGGRWSTTNPPISNFPPELRDGTDAGGGKYITDVNATGIFLPPPGMLAIKYDWDAIEGRLEAIRSRDEKELESYRNRWDIHTLTACTLFNLPLPPVYTKALHTSGEAAAWRAEVAWEGSEDARRHIAKIVRYNLVYALDAKGILESVEKLAPYGVTRDEALAFAQRYLNSRPLMVQTKKQIGTEIARTGQARSAFGRPRQVFGDERARRKEGWSHTISASVSDMGNMVACQVSTRWPDARILMNTHDSQTWAFREEPDKDEFKRIVEGPWEVWGMREVFPATFYKMVDDRREKW